ncbi:MAG: class I SAM-dependent RNA methyltransferase [Chloroflexota bacterium]
MPRRPAPARLDPGIIETVAERIVAGGDAIAHSPNRTLFVAGAAPGDRLRVRLTRNRGAVAWAEIVEVVEPGPDRIEPPHPALARSGAADFAHLRYPAQLAAKAGIIRECLRRTAGIEPAQEIEVEPSPREWGYRARAEWRHDPVTGAVGYLEAGSQRVVDLENDPLSEPDLGPALAEFRERALAGRLPEDATELRAATAGGAISLDPERGGAEPREIFASVAGERLGHDARCFFQANHHLLDGLVAEALRWADAPGTGESLAIDLYCGAGLFTLPLARRFRRVIGVEADARAAGWAQRNAAEAGLAGARISPQPVEHWLREAYRSYGRPPFLLADPPRAGLSRATLSGILRLRPGRIALVSCDLATLARDLKEFAGAGYEVGAIRGFDLFPQTHHVEVVAHLQRTDPA